MNADTNAGFLGYWNYLFDKVRVVFPELLLAVFPAMSQRPFEHLPHPVALRVFFVKGAGRRSAARGFPGRTPDAVAHMGVGGIKNARFRKIAKVLFVLLDFLVAPGQV